MIVTEWTGLRLGIVYGGIRGWLVDLTLPGRRATGWDGRAETRAPRSIPVVAVIGYCVNNGAVAYLAFHWSFG